MLRRPWKSELKWVIMSSRNWQGLDEVEAEMFVCRGCPTAGQLSHPRYDREALGIVVVL